MTACLLFIPIACGDKSADATLPGCEVQASETCLTTLFRQATSRLTEDDKRQRAQAIWVHYLQRRGSDAEALVAAKDIPLTHLVAWAPELAGRPLPDLIDLATLPGRGPLGLLEAAQNAGDLKMLAALLADPRIAATMDASITRFDPGSLDLDATARDRLINQLRTQIRSPMFGNGRVLNQKDSFGYVTAMDMLGARREETEQLVTQLEAEWQGTQPSPNDEKAVMQSVIDGISLAQMYEDLGMLPRRDAVIAQLVQLTTQRKGDDALHTMAQAFAPDLTEEQIAAIVARWQRDGSGPRLAELGLALIRADRGDLGYPLLAAHRADIDADSAAMILDRPQDAALRRELAPNAKPFFRAQSEIARLRDGTTADRAAAIAELTAMAQSDDSPQHVVSYLGAALIAMASSRAGPATPALAP
jgi:hypothetical protein